MATSERLLLGHEFKAAEDEFGTDGRVLLKFPHCVTRIKGGAYACQQPRAAHYAVEPAAPAITPGITLCSNCTVNPATCFGRYDNMEHPDYSCDDCCGHGNEDGYCEPLPAENAQGACQGDMVPRPMSQLPPSAPSLHYCNKCGDFSDAPEHGVCPYLAAKAREYRSRRG